MLRPLFILACTIAPLAIAADDPEPPKKAPPIPAPEVSLKSLTVAPGLRVDLWASEPLLENPVAFAFDNVGRAYVVETNRRRTSTPDIRRNEPWVIPMLAHRTVEDRVAFLKKELAPEKKLKASSTRPDLNKDGQFDWRDLTVEGERVRMVEDSNGDGKADQSRVLAEGFHDLATGTAAGVMPLPPGVGGAEGGVLFTCMPDLWLIKPDGTKTSLSTGYGVHVAYSGHDMHGLRMGPDGRVYFTIADTGVSVMGGDGKRIENPDCGAVLRCWPDGSGLELFAKGLRNPQDLAFNDVGDLFTGDNNADGGDKARITHIVQGADYGWRIGWQFLPKLGAWNSEGMWHLDAGETNPAILPSVAHIGHGPAGFSYYPGTGLPEKYRGHFFMADFPGGVRDFALKPKGASYELADSAPDAKHLQDNKASEMTGKILWNLNPSDVQFPPGGGVMVLDWVRGWEKTGKGRIFRVSAPELDKDPLIAETKQLLGEGLAKKTVAELSKLLEHADQRVRMAAQFELVNRGEDGKKALADTALAGKGLAALHGVWGLGQFAAHGEDVSATMETLLASAKDEVLAQTLKTAFETAKPSAKLSSAVHLLASIDAPRVQFFAAAALALHPEAKNSAAIVEAVQKAKSLEPTLRFAFSHALTRNADSETIAALAKDPSETTRLVALLALREQHGPRVTDFLGDASPRLRLEAARAIHDESIVAAFPVLARLLEGGWTRGDVDKKSESAYSAVMRRAVNVAYRLGNAESAKLLVAGASFLKHPESVRLDALEALAQWTTPLGRDRVLGLVIPGDGARKREDAAPALAVFFPVLLTGSELIGTAALEAAGALKAKETEAACFSVATGAHPTLGKFPAARAAGLRALAAMDSAQLPEALKVALTSPDKVLADAARRIQRNRTPGDAVAQFTAAMKKGTIDEQQEAIDLLGDSDQKGADEQLSLLLFKMKEGKLPAALHLDVIEAAAKRTDSSVLSMIKEWDKLAPKNDPLAPWRECLEGGDAKLGRELFAEKAETACLRCHAVAKQGGDVGPDLAGIATKHDRAYLLRAIVAPDADIAPGYENVLLTLTDGNVLAGLAVTETADTLTLKNVTDGKTQAVKKSTIKERQKLPTAMPPAMGDVLGKRGLRDVVEYLATLK